MSEAMFLSVLQQITARTCTLVELIDAAVRLSAAGQDALAEQLYKVWIGLNPDSPQLFIAYFNCSRLQTDHGDLVGAQEALTHALTLNPDFFPAYINLGGLLERTGAVDLALEQWQAVTNRLAPITGAAVEHKLMALKQMGRVLIDHQRLPAAEAVLRQALEIKPDQRDALEQFTALRMGQCKWPVIEPWANVDRRTLMGGVTPLSFAAYTDDPLLQLAAAKRYIEVSVEDQPGSDDIDRGHARVDLTSRRIRVGYLSSDLRDHAIGYLMAELFELHSRDGFEVFAYYCGPDPKGDLNDRTQAAVEHWIDINALDDAAAARRIAADGIDILVDVNGLTKSARTAVLAYRPAPIVVNWLGYPGSIGSPYHQYIVADDWIVPSGAELYYSETVVRLPCYQSNDRKRTVSPERPTRADVGLPDDGFVFCCFNGSQKFTRLHFDRWLDILKRTPGSVLWLLDGGGSESNDQLTRYAETHGVARERFVFAPKLRNADHLARYPLADLFLDTSPYGAHTTASDALWMGVPVLTLSGRAFAARVCGSLVRAAGLPELICSTAEEYVERAVALATDKLSIDLLRSKLEDNRRTCDLFNMDKLALCLEALYQQMCIDHNAGLSPHPDLTNLDVYFELGIEHDPEAMETRDIADYQGFYRAKLERRHRARPIPPDARLWPPALATN